MLMSSMNVGNRYIRNIRMILKKNGAPTKETNIYTDIVAEGQDNTVGLIVFVYSDQISTIISNKIR